jgi:hypothetical protein
MKALAIISLCALPPVLLLNAWITMKVKQIPPRKWNDEEMRKLAQGLVNVLRLVCLEIQRRKAETK